jgi:hypothetical protein
VLGLGSQVRGHIVGASGSSTVRPAHGCVTTFARCARSKQLLAEAGYPNGFDAGEYFCDAVFTNLAEPMINYLRGVGIPGETAAARARGVLQGARRQEAPRA